MDQASQWMRLIGGLALLTPFVLSRIPALRQHTRVVGLALAVLYIGFGIAFILWYTLVRVPPA